ncbi:MAG: hypothetical protein ABEJ26_05645 [Halosimplex sp.]
MTISFRGWVEESLSHLRDGDRKLSARMARPAYYLWVGAFLSYSHWRTYGTNVYDREWDLLVVLDACRVDAMREVADEYDFVERVDVNTSVGSTSFEWMDHTFTNDYLEEVRNTAYLSQNSFTARVPGGGYTGKVPIPFGPSEYDTVERDDFGRLEELWRADFEEGSEWTISSDVVTRPHPRYTTERVIEAGRTTDFDRLMVHYMYPHDPYPLADEVLQPRFDSALKDGSATREEAWDAYVENLRFVLDQVEVLLENVDAENVVITADHGEAFGERSFYRHPVACPLDCVRKVPWVETTAADEETVEPTAPAPDEADTAASVEDRLEQLGYR